MRYAIVENGVVVNTAVSDSALSESWIQSDTAQIGQEYDGENFADPAKTLAESQAEKIKELKARCAEDMVAPIDYDGKTWKGDTETQQLLTGALVPGSTAEQLHWRDASGTNHQVTYADLQAIAKALRTRGFSCDDKLHTKIASVVAAATVSEVDAISWEQ